MQAKTLMKLVILLTSYLLQDNILVLNTNLTLITFKLPPILAGIIFSNHLFYCEVKQKRQMKQTLMPKNFIKLLQFLERKAKFYLIYQTQFQSGLAILY